MVSEYIDNNYAFVYTSIVQYCILNQQNNAMIYEKLLQYIYFSLHRFTVYVYQTQTWYTLLKNRELRQIPIHYGKINYF